MTAEPKVSIVIVSRDRPAELKRILVSLRYLQFLNFEVIVVSNIDPRERFSDIHSISRVKFVRFDLANISAARNLGILHAKGEIVAFCDDDAVPEPTWLKHLTAPFADKEVAAVGGYVLGRNGISFQWKGRSFDVFGEHTDLEVAGTDPRTFQGNAEKGIKTEGTNCAFRREILLKLHGFDENFHYYLDETDLNYRIGLAGWKTAIVPLAQVHHGFSSNKTRHENRAPKSLFDIGASKAWYCKKHVPVEMIAAALEDFAGKQRRRLIRFMVDGVLEPREIAQLEESLRLGMQAGLNREAITSPDFAKAKNAPFQRFLTSSKPSQLQAVSMRKKYAFRKNRNPINSNNTDVCVTYFMFSISSVFHQMEFSPDGYWMQNGGLFGRSDRRARIFKLFNLNSRTLAEVKRISDVRPIAIITPYSGFNEAMGNATSP